jgi:hypothetical protein
MFMFGGGLGHKMIMIGTGLILLCVGFQMARDTIASVLVPMVPWLIVVAVILGMVIVLRILNKYLSR